MEVIPENDAGFPESTMNDNHKLCISLDDAPFYCSPLKNLNMTFAGLLEGQHSLSAKIWKDGDLLEVSHTEDLFFTTINDLSLIDPGNDNKKKRHIPAEQKSNNKPVTVDYPYLKLASPMFLGTYYPNLPLRIELEPSNKEEFEKYFKYGYKCFCIDGASGFGCFPLYSSEHNNPLVLGLTPGMHTAEAILLHPDSGDLLPLSSSGTITFFIVGKSNQGAIMTADFEMDGLKYSIPIANGGDITTQATIFCSDNEMPGADCVLSVSNHLKNIAIQLNLLKQ